MVARQSFGEICLARALSLTFDTSIAPSCLAKLESHKRTETLLIAHKYLGLAGVFSRGAKIQPQPSLSSLQDLFQDSSFFLTVGGTIFVEWIDEVSKAVAV